MKPIVLFGAGKIAEVVLYFFNQNNLQKVVACTTDRDYLPASEWNSLPMVPFENLTSAYPPEHFDVFVALGYQELNSLRAKKCEEARALGYTLASYIHQDPGLPKDFEHGDNCFVMNQAIIHPKVHLGNNVFVWGGGMIGHHSKVGDNCWLTSCCNISGMVTVGDNCFLAVNSTISNSVKVGNRCFIGANTLVTMSTKDNAAYVAESSKPFRLNSQQLIRRMGKL